MASAVSKAARGFSGTRKFTMRSRRKTLCIAEEIRAIYGAENDASAIQSSGERRFKHIAAHGIRSRLKRGPNFAAGPAGSGGFDAWRESRWDDARNRRRSSNSGGFAAKLEAAAHAAKSGESFGDGFARNIAAEERWPRRRAR